MSDVRLACAITGLGVLCRQAAAGGATPQPADPDAWFQHESYLSAREARYMTKAARLAAAAATLALQDLALGESQPDAADIGVVIGTNFAATRVIADMDAALLRQGIAGVRPLEAPYFSINLPASHISMKFGLRAFNITLTNPAVAGLEAIAVACQSLERGRARLVLAGALEADPPAAHGAFGAAHLESGACVLALERGAALPARGARAYAIVSGHASTFVDPGAASTPDGELRAIDSITRLVKPLLEPRGALIVAGSAARAGVGRLAWSAVERALRDAGQEFEIWKGLGADGCHASVSPVLALATIAAASANALVFAASPRGQLVLVRIVPPAPGLRRDRPGTAISG